MKKIFLTIATIVLLASCGGGSSDEAKALQEHILKLIGIPQEIVVNICQDDNDNGTCDPGELQAKISVNKNDSIQEMWAKVAFDENGQYILKNYDPTKSIIMELNGAENTDTNITYNNVALNLKYKPKPIEEIQELSVLQAVIDADFLTEDEAKNLKASVNRNKIDEVLFNSLTRNQALLEDANVSKGTALAINLEEIANGLKDLNISNDLPQRLADCENNNSCIEAIVTNAEEEIELTQKEVEELAKSKKVADGYIIELNKPLIAVCANGKEYKSSTEVQAQGEISFEKFPVGTDCNITVHKGAIIDSDNNGKSESTDKVLEFDMVGSGDDTFITPLTTLLYQKKRKGENVTSFARMIQNYNPVIAPSRSVSNTGIEKVKIQKLIILMEVLKTAMKRSEDITKLDLSKIITTSSTEKIEDFKIDLLISSLSPSIQALVEERAETIKSLILMLKSLDPAKISLDTFFISVSDGGKSITDSLNASLQKGVTLPAGMQITDFIFLPNVSNAVKDILVSEIKEIEENDNTDETITISKARYVDENVSGIDYISKFGCKYDSSTSQEVCERNITGTTTADGTFQFIVGGNGVHFSIAGLTLDYIPSKYLVENAVITVTDAKLASFLQSIDNDANASNGIVIEPVVVSTLKALNISQYEHLSSSDLEVSSLVSEIKAKLDNTSNIKLQLIDESEALIHLNNTIASYKPLASITVEKVIDDIENLFDNIEGLSEEEIQEKVKAVRTQLDNPLTGDKGLVDIQIAKALLDLSELTNQTYLEDVLTFGGDTKSKLSQLIKESALNNGQELVVSREENATNVIEVSKQASIDIASNLKNISDKLGASLATLPQHYTFAYENFNISLDNITTLRAMLLAVASKMTLATAYHVGQDSDYIPKTFTDTNGSTYQYQDVNIRKDELINNEGYGVANNQTALTSAKQYLLESALLLKNLDPLNIRSDFNESVSNNSDEIDSNKDIIDYASKLYKVLSEGTGTFSTSNTDDDGEKEEFHFALNRIFNVQTALKPSDFGTAWEYKCDNYDFQFGKVVLGTEIENKKENEIRCYYEDDRDVEGNRLTSHSADFEAKIDPQSETSSLDELITKIIINDSVVKTGQEVIDYIFKEDEGSSNQTPIVTNQFTLEKIAGKTFYSLTTDGSNGRLIQYASDGKTRVDHPNTLVDNGTGVTQNVAIDDNGVLQITTPSTGNSFSIKLLEENVNSKYNRILIQLTNKDIEKHLYFNKADAENALSTSKEKS